MNIHDEYLHLIQRTINNLQEAQHMLHASYHMLQLHPEHRDVYLTYIIRLDILCYFLGDDDQSLSSILDDARENMRFIRDKKTLNISNDDILLTLKQWYHTNTTARSPDDIDLVRNSLLEPLSFNI